MSFKSSMTAIADTLRAKTGKSDKLTLNQMPTEINDAYEAGKKTEYDEFWDNHPTAKGYCNGTNLFSGAGWNNVTFKPKFDIILGHCYMAFKSCAVTDLVERLKECGVILDLSKATNFYYAFTESNISHIGEIHLTHSNFSSSTTGTISMFATAYDLHTIDKIVVNNEGTTKFSNSMFDRANSLSSITFEGVIGTSINFQWCPLTRESIANVIEHLSPIVTGQTVTFKKSAKETAFTNDEWAELTATKPNWTFSLV